MTRPSKTGFFAAVRRWDAVATGAILAAEPALVAATDPKGRAALHLACSVKPGLPGLGEPNGIETVRALLDAGAGLEAEVPMPGDEGDFRATPIWYAAARGENLPLVRFLIACGADTSSCLWAAVWRDDAVLCGALLAAKPRLNLRAEGETPIFYAARLQRLKTLDLLIEAGADPTIPDPRRRTAIDIARERRIPRAFIDRMMTLQS